MILLVTSFIHFKYTISSKIFCWKCYAEKIVYSSPPLIWAETSYILRAVHTHCSYPFDIILNEIPVGDPCSPDCYPHSSP